MVASLSPSPTPCGDSDSLVEETDTLLSHFNDSSPDYETFCFDIEEKSSGSTTFHFDHSLLDYEAFCFDVDHIIEKSSGSTTSHSDLSLPESESFHFDLSIYHLPSADRSDYHHEEFIDDLAHIISPPEYDHFYFDLEADPGELPRVQRIENEAKTVWCMHLNKRKPSRDGLELGSWTGGWLGISWRLGIGSRLARDNRANIFTCGTPRIGTPLVDRNNTTSQSFPCLNHEQ
ncbi:hypothetical protein Tco_0639559 [Tanacetum coccineum]